MPGAARSGFRRDRPRTTGAFRARPRSGAWGDPRRPTARQSASRPETASAGWALRAGRKSSSTPRCTLVGPSSNQQPPRTASSGGLGTRGRPSRSFEERRGPGLGLRAGRHGQLHVVDADHTVRGLRCRHGRSRSVVPRRSRRSGWSSGTSTRWMRRPSGSSIQASIRPHGSRAAGRITGTPRLASSTREASRSRTCSHRTTASRPCPASSGPVAGGGEPLRSPR